MHEETQTRVGKATDGVDGLIKKINGVSSSTNFIILFFYFEFVIMPIITGKNSTALKRGNLRAPAVDVL